MNSRSNSASHVRADHSAQPPRNRRWWTSALATAAIFFIVGGETRANKQAIAAFRSRWEQPSRSELVLSVDPQSVVPSGADLGSHRLSVESTEALNGAPNLGWTEVTNYTSGLQRFSVRGLETNGFPAFYRLRLTPR